MGADSDPEIRRLGLAGSIDQYADSTDLLDHPSLAQRVGAALLGDSSA